MTLKNIQNSKMRTGLFVHFFPKWGLSYFSTFSLLIINFFLLHIHLLVILLKNVKQFLIGILLGAGAILPGISSGVLCVIFGMYDKLINSVLGLFKNFKKNAFYLLPIFLGGIVGVFLFGNLLEKLFQRFPVQTSYCFIGLILGSIPILVKKINSEYSFKLRYLFLAIATFIVGCFFVFLENTLNLSNTVTEFSFSFLVLSGFLMSIGVVFPGVSNTLILMCMRCLPYLLK